MNIQKVKKVSPKLKKFQDEEWLISDIEHYGKARNFEKKSYKFMAKDKNEILGVLDLVIEANVAFLEGLVVNHNHRAKGIGKNLLLFAENFAKENKCTKIWTETDEDWEAAKFYKKMGYEICGVHEKHYLGRKGLILTKFF
ncbi:TPA: hypothetical protein DCQ85_01800 [Candidatus Magasanikbacteria bacterium]|nr:hypothetical protein [Candidatus Magasanikbacteria bacterium]